MFFLNFLKTEIDFIFISIIEQTMSTRVHAPKSPSKFFGLCSTSRSQLTTPFQYQQQRSSFVFFNNTACYIVKVKKCSDKITHIIKQKLTFIIIFFRARNSNLGFLFLLTNIFELYFSIYSGKMTVPLKFTLCLRVIIKILKCDKQYYKF